MSHVWLVIRGERHEGSYTLFVSSTQELAEQVGWCLAENMNKENEEPLSVDSTDPGITWIEVGGFEYVGILKTEIDR